MWPIVKEGCAARSVGFHTTRWSLVISAGNGAGAKNQEALAELCKHYWYPLYAFARRSGYNAHDSQDLTQSFFQHLFEAPSLFCVGSVKVRPWWGLLR